ncbi:YIF1-domain-containing protein, partial [Fistulina hepatica ATCC 64428]
PPLRHPVPTHPAYIPEPPSTPGSPATGYQRYSSSPQPNQNQPQTSQYFWPGVGMAGLGVNDATAQIGMQLGHSAVAAGQEYMQKNFGSLIPRTISVKHHFNVSNSYVLHKLQVVLFPWIHKPWGRRKASTGAERQYNNPYQQPQNFLPPRQDINSPDLYIPTMAIITYVLVNGLQQGLQGGFKPQVLGELFSMSLFVIFCDLCFIKLGCFLLSIPSSDSLTMVDLIAYAGYKFVG